MPTEGLRDEIVGGGLSSIRATDERVQRGRTGAVRDSDGTSELDEVASGDRWELGEEGDQVVDTVCNTEVGEEGRLDGGKDEHRPVGSATTVEGSCHNEFEAH